MTNSTDLFQPEYEKLALPAQRVIVLIDDVVCSDVEPVEIVRSGWPQFDRVRLSCITATPDVREQMEDRFSSGVPVCIQQLYDANPPQQTPRALTVFAGQIDSLETTISGQTEKLEITARDASAILERVTVYGQRIVQSDDSTILLAGLQTIFNPHSRGNAAARPITRDAKTYVPFSSDPGESRIWTCAEAIAYLLCEHLPSGMVHWPDVAQLEALTGRQRLYDLDVTGMTLLEALHQCAECAGLAFRFVPQMAETHPRQSLVFYRNGDTRCIELNAQPAGQSFSICRTNIAGLQSERRFHPVTHRTIGQGDFKIYEATFELVGAWDPGLEDTNYAKFSASTNAGFRQVKDVYRKWCLNEAGDYTLPPFNRGEPFDLSCVFETRDYAHRRRRFWPALSEDDQGRSLGYFLEVSFDDGSNWWQYLYPFNNLLDECGIWLSGDRLDVNTWVAALKGVLKFRITASVISDERLTCTVADGPVGSTTPVIDHLLTLPSQFQYRKISPRSILRQTSNPSDQVDDTAALHDFVRGQAARSSSATEIIHAQTPSLWLHLYPGDNVTSGPDSRDWLGCRRDNRSVAWIERVRMDFRHQYTELAIVRQRQ
jgi:hypothetical protein